MIGKKVDDLFAFAIVPSRSPPMGVLIYACNAYLGSNFPKPVPAQGFDTLFSFDILVRPFFLVTPFVDALPVCACVCGRDCFRAISFQATAPGGLYSVVALAYSSVGVCRRTRRVEGTLINPFVRTFHPCLLAPSFLDSI